MVKHTNAFDHLLVWQLAYGVFHAWIHW